MKKFFIFYTVWRSYLSTLTLGVLVAVMVILTVFPRPLSASHSNTDAPATLTEHNIPVLFPVQSVASARSGNWSDPATWAPAGVPGAGADVHILPGHIVTYDVSSDVALRSLSVFGTLQFSRTLDTKLQVGYTLVHPGGYLQIGTPADPIPAGRRAEVVIADAAIDLARDPLQWGTGINVLGRIDVAGAPLSKTFVRLTREPRAGDTTLTLAEAVTGWQPGDRLIVPDTRRVDYDMRTGQWGNPPFSYFIDDVKVASVSGTTVTLQSALKYDHFASYLGKRGAGGIPEFYPHVVNLTRNVVVRSANPAGTRGQVSFLDRARVDVRYAEFVDLGRTRGEVPLGSPDPTRPGYSNQVGRYPVHLHHLKGPLTTDPDKPQYQGTNYQAIILGNSTHHEVSNPPKGWYTVHQTHYSLIQDNVGYNANGVGYYFEDGPERENLVKHNIGIRVNGHGGRVDSDQNNPATDGTIFYFKGPMNRVIDNVAANANAYGMIFFFKYAGKQYASPAPGADFTQQYDLNATPLTEVRGNEAYGAMVNGMAVWWLNLFGSPQYSQPNAPMSVVKDFTVWHVQDYGVFNYEVQSLTWDHLVVRGDETRPGNVGMYFADYYQINSRILNPDIQGVNTGILKPFITSFAGEVGVTTIEGTGGGCLLKNKANIATYTPWHNSGGAGARTPSQLVVRNCKFAYSGVGPASEQYHIYRQVVARDVANYAALDSLVVYDFNQVAGDNFAVYYEEQNPAAIMPASSGNIVGSPEAGLTNQQAWAKYGVALAGAVAPCTTARAGIEGYACALSGVAPTVAITSPAAGASITGTSVTATFATSGDRTQADHLHLQLDALPEVRGIALDGSYTFTNVAAGSHTLRVYLAKADHTALTSAGVSASVVFTTQVAVCTPNWQCDATWSTCVNGTQIRTCTDLNACGVTTNKPAESQSCTVVTPPPTGSGLVASYGFNEGSGTTATDNSGNGHIGALAGPVWIVAGKNGGALSFDGINDRVNIASTPKLELASAFTLSAWAYPTSVTDWRTVAMKGAADYDLYTSASNNLPGTQASIAGDWRELFGPFTLATNAWVHIAGTYDGAAQRLYINGVEVASRAQTGAIRTSVNPLTIGGNVNWGEYFAGRLDDVRVYSRALSAAEITSDMNTPVGAPSVPPPVFSEKIITNPSLTRLGTHTVAESSGLVASRVYPGIYWMIGDSGNPASIYAVNSTGRLVKSFAVSGSTNIDWEDIALDENNNIWIADVGDNAQTRANYILYRVSEPNPAGNLVSVTATAFKFIYPDGKKDSEGVFIWQNIPYIIQKRPTNARVYKFPEINSSKIVTLEFVGEFKNNNNWITGADISRDGRRLALINDGADYHWVIERAPGSASINDFFTAPMNQWRIQFSNNQGEAIGFVDGSYDFAVASETGDFWKIAQSVYDSGAAPVDTVAPVILSSSPSGVLSADMKSAALTLATSESSVCRYATTSNTGFALMTGNFTQITPTSHSANIAGLVNGASYAYYVRCQDTAGNVMLADYNITFRVAQSASSSGTRFAVIGDYGWAGAPERDVADLVKNSNPDFIITTGDNNYDNGSASSIDANIGQYYHDYIYPYNGVFGAGARANKFFPSLGNHDWGSPGAAPYLNYFTLPGNERYYDFVKGPIHFFAIDSDPNEPDGITSTSRQALWLKDKLANSTSQLQIVYFHHSPYSSGATHGSTPALQWPLKDWGADLVLSGHDHTYERLSVNGLTYAVVGTGGKSLYQFGTPVAPSQVRYNSDYGALIGEADQTKVTFTFLNRAGAVIDTFSLPLQPLSLCTPNWQCDEVWSACVNGIQTRTCRDANTCGVTTNKPAESQSCTASTANLVNISFSIKLEGRNAAPIRDFTMAFFHTVTGVKVAELTAKPDPATGTILLPSTIVLPKQEYDVVVSISGYLKKRARINPDSNTAIELPLLPAGDFNDDNIINSIDYFLMNAKWFNSDAIMDINGDDIVNSLDFSFLNRNWNKSGD